MAKTVERYHWVNTLVGVLDDAFHLTEEEQFHVIDITRKLLTGLRVPERGVPTAIPAALSLEVNAGFYAQSLAAARTPGLPRPVRPASGDDCVVSIESWRTALLSMLVVAYPDIAPVERVYATKVLHDLLAAIGVPNRAAFCYPEDVIAAYLSGPDLTGWQH
jgi:hypothetical protein